MTPKEKTIKVRQYCFCVTVLGLTQKEAAEVVGISEKLAGTWTKEYELKKAIDEIQADMKKHPLNLKYDDSLHAFMAFLRIHTPETYNTLENHYKQFLKSV